MLECILEVVGQRPEAALLDELHRCRGDHLILVVNELRKAVFGVADPRLQQRVAALDLFLDRQLLEHRHHALAQRASRAMLSRYSAALALMRASPCASDQRAAEMSFHG